MAIGIPSWGFAGWFLGFVALKYSTGAAVVCFIVGTIFSVLAVAYLFFLKKVHRQLL